MPHTDPDLRNDPEAWLDHLLAQDAAVHDAEYLVDAGFTARVMSALPASLLAPRWRRPVEWALWGIAGTAIAATLLAPRWRRPDEWALWGIAGTAIAATLPSMATDVAREMFRLVATQPISPAYVLAVLAAMGAATFGGAAFVLRRE